PVLLHPKVVGFAQASPRTGWEVFNPPIGCDAAIPPERTGNAWLEHARSACSTTRRVLSLWSAPSGRARVARAGAPPSAARGGAPARRAAAPEGTKDRQLSWALTSS